jgi:hypothetical protein
VPGTTGHQGGTSAGSNAHHVDIFGGKVKFCQAEMGFLVGAPPRPLWAQGYARGRLLSLALPTRGTHVSQQIMGLCLL